jgi:hypothetical protein
MACGAFKAASPKRKGTAGRGIQIVLIFLKSYQDFMFKDMELRLKKRASRAQRKGTAGRGIQIVLLNGTGQNGQGER